MAPDNSLITIISHLNLRQNNPLGLDPFISEESSSDSDHYLGMFATQDSPSPSSNPGTPCGPMGMEFSFLTVKFTDIGSRRISDF